MEYLFWAFVIITALGMFIAGYIAAHFFRGGKFFADSNESWRSGYNAGWRDAGAGGGKSELEGEVPTKSDPSLKFEGTNLRSARWRGASF